MASESVIVSLIWLLYQPKHHLHELLLSSLYGLYKLRSKKKIKNPRNNSQRLFHMLLTWVFGLQHVSTPTHLVIHWSSLIYTWDLGADNFNAWLIGSLLGWFPLISNNSGGVFIGSIWWVIDVGSRQFMELNSDSKVLISVAVDIKMLKFLKNKQEMAALYITW